ncbi:hypothetical protein KIN20_020487 [Parelaphostrongylus tenuis]|uniref:Uncharacterized protein n=1 Tax=Parelaphostrongylus tenuis TaxID=148309 RepID=A0AAD5QVK4_PARTN|nr:hypothetical protein KIN20_020487 [Parelaphostrongylus tenuis]
MFINGVFNAKAGLRKTPEESPIGVYGLIHKHTLLFVPSLRTCGEGGNPSLYVDGDLAMGVVQSETFELHQSPCYTILKN